jgi:predicted Zn-ribbon and HTH transcriptional regulator
VLQRSNDLFSVMGVHLTTEGFDVKGFFHCTSILGRAAMMIFACAARCRRTRFIMSAKTNPWTLASGTFQCPQCGSRDTRKSYPSGLIDALMMMFELTPYRCRQCRKRFIRRPVKQTEPQTAPPGA